MFLIVTGIAVVTSSFILKLFLTLSATIGLAIGLIGEATTAVGGDIPRPAAAAAAGATTAGATTVGIDVVVAIELASLTAAMERTSRSQDSAGKYESETFLIFKSPSTSSDCNKIESKAELKY